MAAPCSHLSDAAPWQAVAVIRVSREAGKVARSTGFEPALSDVTGRRFGPLSYERSVAAGTGPASVVCGSSTAHRIGALTGHDREMLAPTTEQYRQRADGRHW